MNKEQRIQKLVVGGTGIHDDSLDAVNLALAPQQKQATVKELMNAWTRLYQEAMRETAVSIQFLLPYREEAKMKSTYKLTILYDNGKSYVVKEVQSHNFVPTHDGVKREFTYSEYDHKTKIHATYRIPAKDIAAITVRKQDEIIVTRVKPCAVISGGAAKRDYVEPTPEPVAVTVVKPAKRKVAKKATKKRGKKSK